KLGDQKAVKYLSAASGQPFIGNDAVEALASLGGYDAVKALASITSSGKFPADRKAQEVMQSLGDDRGLEPLKELAENSDDINVRTKARSAIDAITKLEKKDDRHSISDIRSRARSRHKADSQNSATSMLEPGTIEPPLGDVAAKVRLSAINALSETKDDLAAAALIEIMKNNKEKTVIRNAAGKSLAANFNVRSLVNEYKTDLAKDSDNDIETIVSSAKCLGYLGTDEAVKKLIEIDEDAFALRNLTFELRSAPGDMRNKKDLLIIGSLGVSGNKKALTHLANSRVNFTNIDVICDALNQFNDPSCLKDLAKNSVNDPKAYTQKLDLIRNLGSLKYASDIAVMLKGRAVRKDIVNILDDWKWQPTTTEDKCFYYLAKQQHDKCKSLGTAGFQVYLTAFRHGMETEIADILIDTHGTEVKQILLDNLRSYFDGRLGTRFNKTHLTFLNEKFNWHPTSPDDKLYVALSTDKNALKELCRKDPKVGRLLKDKLLDSDMNVSYSLASMLIKIAADDMIPAMISRLDKEKNNVKRKNGWHKVRPYFELLINSGNEQLTNGAKNWAENNGIKINYIDMPTAQTSMWGQ
ncbi:MAG: HEAT repeat domain-containing protein, partial [Anaerohalosphaera sp.]|nr:HEAT repeat domain-containing protein [Anaerohalosphaera sp.]